jgi:hypothetical protein
MLRVRIRGSGPPRTSTMAVVVPDVAVEDAKEVAAAGD